MTPPMDPDFPISSLLIPGPGGSTEHPGLPIFSTNSLWEPRGIQGPPKEAGAGNAERVAEAAGERAGRRAGRRSSEGAGAFLRAQDGLGITRKF